MENWQLQQLQNLPLEIKIEKTKLRIIEWYEYHNGEVYISFSGGKDSTVLLHLIRSMYPEIEAVFVDTGLEFPEIRDFVKTIENVTWIKPKMRFDEVIKKYGYPLITKEVSRDISTARNKPNGKTADKFVRGGQYHLKYGDTWLLEKWNFLKDSDIPMSNKCCSIMKKQPFKDFEKQSKKMPFIGTMASESILRKKEWLNNGCNAFDIKNPSSKPLSFWVTQDIWDYIKMYNVPYSKIYDMGYDRTGCMFCMFGVHLEKHPNRFQIMKETHPKQYNYCISQLGCGRVLDFIKVKY